MAGRKPLPLHVGTRSSTPAHGRTLVLHPYDESTQFLRAAYAGIDDICLVTDFSCIGDEEVKDMIRNYDRIIMLGHGTETGLYDRTLKKYVVHSGMASALEGKNCLFIWCNANIFKERYDLTGFATGMFISETGEAYDCGIRTTAEDINESNKKFAEALNEALKDGRQHPGAVIFEKYRLSRFSPCVKANREYMFYD